MRERRYKKGKAQKQGNIVCKNKTRTSLSALKKGPCHGRSHRIKHDWIENRGRYLTTSLEREREMATEEIRNGKETRCSSISRALSSKWHSRVMCPALKGKQQRSLDVMFRLNLIPALCPCRNEGARRQTSEK